MKGETLIERYNLAASQGIPLVDMDSLALTGYYLSQYPGDPVGAVRKDILAYRVSETVGRSVIVMLVALIRDHT